jgi:hypothetical protein
MSIPSLERAYKEGKAHTRLAIGEKRTPFFPYRATENMSRIVDLQLLELTPTAVFMRLTGVP